MKEGKTRNHDRAPGSRHLTASVDCALVDSVDRLAAAEGRNRSEMLRVLLKEAISARSKLTADVLAGMSARELIRRLAAHSDAGAVPTLAEQKEPPPP